jgi:hypothetical protein
MVTLMLVQILRHFNPRSYQIAGYSQTGAGLETPVLLDRNNLSSSERK